MRRFCTSIRLASVLGPGAPMLYPSFLGPTFCAALPLLYALKQSTQARFRRSTGIRGGGSRFEFLSLDIRICFGFRASDFGFEPNIDFLADAHHLPPATCTRHCGCAALDS